MERIRGHDAGELLSMALDWLPASVATRLGFVHFFMGDPVFAGLHEFEVADDGVPTGPLPSRFRSAARATDRGRRGARPSCCRLGHRESAAFFDAISLQM